MNIALFASGNGSNVMAILEALKEYPEAKVVTLICDNPNALVMNKVKQHQLDTALFQPKDFTSRQAWEEAMVEYLNAKKVDLICLAGYMRILGQPLLSAFPKKIINIHPALLPNFPGREGIQDAYYAGVSETGVTIHYVDEGIDTGEVIVQEKLSIDPSWSLETLEQHIHEIEHRIYPQTIIKMIDKFQKEDING